jgi:hypothetical protein
MPIATALAVLLAASAASAQPLPVPKVGQWPSGYRERRPLRADQRQSAGPLCPSVGSAHRTGHSRATIASRGGAAEASRLSSCCEQPCVCDSGSGYGRLRAAL